MNCIIQNGVQYCNQALTIRGFGIALLGIVAYIFWICFSLWVAGKVTKSFSSEGQVGIILGLLPVIVVGLICLI